MVAALAMLERCVMPVSMTVGGYWCVMDSYGTSAARGTVVNRCSVLTDGFLLSERKF